MYVYIYIYIHTYIHTYTHNNDNNNDNDNNKDNNKKKKKNRAGAGLSASAADHVSNAQRGNGIGGKGGLRTKPGLLEPCRAERSKGSKMQGGALGTRRPSFAALRGFADNYLLHLSHLECRRLRKN